MKVMRRFMVSFFPFLKLISDGRELQVKSAMRTEINHQVTSKVLTGVHQDIKQGLQILTGVQKDVFAIRMTQPDAVMQYGSHEASAATGNDFIRNIITFAQSIPSASAPMLRTPDAMTEELMTTAYIKFQLNVIVMTVGSMGELPMSGSLDSIANFRIFSTIEMASMSITHLRHHVVRQVTTIRDLLDNKPIQAISILDCADGLNRLSSGLEILGMGRESVMVGEWAIMLARTLVNVSGGGQSDLCASLAQFLLHQSIRYESSGPKSTPGFQAIEEAHAITENLGNQYRGEVHFQMLYSNILLQYASSLDNNLSIGMSVEAVQVLEDILNVHSFTRSRSHKKVVIESVVHPSSAFLDQLSSSAPPRSAITDYARALQQLGQFIFLDGQFTSALHLELLAIAIHRMMVSINGPEYNVYLAKALSSPVRRRLGSSFPATDLAHMADECIVLLRELVEKNPLPYSRELVFVLCDKASILGTLDGEAEAISTWEEASKLAVQIVQDSKLCASTLDNLSLLFRRLRRHDDAVKTRTLAITTHRHEDANQALRHLYLSEDLLKLQRFKESAEAARTSVTMYRRLAMSDLGTWTVDLTQSLSNLAVCLATSGDFSEALITWKELMNMLENHLNIIPDQNQTIFDEDLAALDRSIIIGHILDDEEECLNICSTSIRYLRRVYDIYRENPYIIESLLSAEFRYTHNMARYSRLRDAQQYIDHWINVWNQSSPPEVISEFEIAVWHAKMVTLKANVLNAQGYTEQALLVIQEVRDILGLSLNIYRRSVEEMIYAKILEAQLQAYIGNNEGALQMAEGALQFAQNNKLGTTLDGQVWSLHAVGLTALLSHNYERASEAAREGCKISTSPDWQKDTVEYNIYVFPSLFAILSFAEANLGRYDAGVDYAHRAVEASLEIKRMRNQISMSFSDLSYMGTRGNLADILLATGDLVQARQICEERSAYFNKRVEKQMGDYRVLVPILRVLGVLYCSEGLHEKGEAAAQELSRIMKLLGDVFPSLQEQVKICLRHQANVPILKVLRDMSEKLACKHQKEVPSLFVV